MSNLTIADVRSFIENQVAREPSRMNAPGIWEKPITVSAPIDDRFTQLPEIAMDEHLHPYDLLPSAQSLVVFFIPFKKEIVKANRPGDRPCREWGLAYVRTNDLINRIGQTLAQYMRQRGFKTGLTPATHNFDEATLMARWSHKHLAHLAGLGRFGVHHMLITPKGCCGRMGSLVSEARLGDHPLMSDAEACLFKAGYPCGKCIQRCPIVALTENDFNRRACWDRLNDNIKTLEYFSDLPDSTDVCGKCAAVVPCSFLNPVKKLDKRFFLSELK